MARRYWLDVFSGEGWDAFLGMGASITGFRKRKQEVAERVRPGDYFLCYISGIARFIGVTEALSACFLDDTPIFKKETLPVRFKVKLVHRLEPETAVPILELKDRLFLFAGIKDLAGLSARFKGCPMELEHGDGKVILAAIEEALAHPEHRDYKIERH